MKILEMVGALQLDKLGGKETRQPNQLMTIWGEKFMEDFGQKALDEYPRPQMVREDYTILNGTWKYAITKDDIKPSRWDGGIRVPFSPESYMSGVGRQLKPNEYLWYGCDIDIAEVFERKKLLLNFGAVDERCRVYVNGIQTGKHSGGYQSFSIDITKYIKKGKNTLLICVQDKSDTSYHGRGKQKLINGGMFYTAQSGIWQTVWCEWVPEVYIKELMITPDYDDDSVIISTIPNIADENKKIKLKAAVFEGDKLIAQEETVSVLGEKTSLTIHIDNKRPWTPESPFLYGLRILYGEDMVESYFGMRVFSVEKDAEGVARMCLNHEPYFQNGILDQGYYPESLMTPVSDKAMINDIKTAKYKGFNMIRKHCKIEPMRWYYHCDRLGMLVWQDMINGGSNYNLLKTCYVPTVVQSMRNKKDDDYAFMGRESQKGRLEWKKECKDTIKQLYNCTSICTWVLFNEGWGQFDAVENTEMVRKLDDTRIIDSHSGWFDQGAGDVKSEHVYFFDLEIKPSDKPYVISEYGGISLPVDNHIYSESHFGYGKHENKQTYTTEYEKLKERVAKLEKEGLCAAVYTQLTDIEEEVNGIMTYDRKIIKI